VKASWLSGNLCTRKIQCDALPNSISNGNILDMVSINYVLLYHDLKCVIVTDQMRITCYE